MHLSSLMKDEYRQPSRMEQRKVLFCKEAIGGGGRRNKIEGLNSWI